MAHHTVVEAAQAAASHPLVQATPASLLVGAKVFGLSLPDWAALGGLLLIGVQIGYYLWRWRKEARG